MVAKACAIAGAALVLALSAISCGSGSGPAAASQSPQSRVAIARYRSYLEGKSAELASATGDLLTLIRAGDVAAAQSRYASDRVLYGQIEPASELFGALDLRIDAGPDDVPPDELAGFHRIERELWVDGDPPSLVPAAERLRADVSELRHRIQTVDLRGARIVRSASEVLSEVSASEIQGKEEPHARIDLVDIAANVEGVEAAFKAVAPTVREADPGLATKMRARFEDAYAGLGNFGWAAREPDQPRPSSPGTSFVLYYVRTQAEFHELDRKIKALGELFSQAQNEIFG